MANGSYAIVSQSLIQAGVDWENDDFLLVGVDATYTFDEDHASLDDIDPDAILDTDEMVTSIAGQYADADDCSLTVAVGKTLRGLIIVKDTGVSSTSIPLIWMDTNALDNTAINRPGTGTAFAINWPAVGIFKIR